MSRHLARTGAVAVLTLVAGACSSGAPAPAVCTAATVQTGALRSQLATRPSAAIGDAACSETAAKASILATAEAHYVYKDLLVSSADPAQYAHAQDYLDALTAQARAEGRDRGWSYLMPDAQYQQYYQQGQSAGLGFSFTLRGAPPSQRLLVTQVFRGSPAWNAGFRRGDEIVAIGPTPDGLTPVANAPNDGSAGSLGDLLGPGTAGLSRSFSVIPVGQTAAVPRTAVKAVYDLDPVPPHQIYEAGGHRTGYVALRTFIPPADDALRCVFADFKAQGVTEVVVDLRYNGGGALSTAGVLADLLGGSGRSGSTMYTQQTNTGQHTYAFGNEPQSSPFTRVAFIVTHQSASASELVPNALDPYLPIAYVGETTYGKPAGQYIFDVEPAAACATKLFLLSFRLVNRDGNGEYYTGLPDAASRGPLCPAADDLAHPQDSDQEAMTAAAIAFARTGSCPAAPTAAAALRAAEPAGTPLAVDPTPAQRDIPGLF